MPRPKPAAGTHRHTVPEPVSFAALLRFVRATPDPIRAPPDLHAGAAPSTMPPHADHHASRGDALRYQLLAIVVTVASCAIFTSASANDEESGLWTSASVMKRYNENLSADLTMQLRFDDDIDRLERTLLRPSVSWHFASRQAVTFGYDAHFIHAPNDLVEQRLWQQYQVSHDFSPIIASLRIRLEERFIDHVDEVPVRVRLKAGAEVPVAGTPWRFMLANEAFIGFTDTARSQRDGFHENRAFIGFGRALSPELNGQIGYQNQFFDGRARDRMIHQLFIGVALKLP